MTNKDTKYYVDRFFDKVHKLSGENSCWIWIAGEDKNGYGKFHLMVDGKAKTIRAHRYSWELYTGSKIPKRILICHTCDVTRCVNPHHLFLGTNLDNMQDRDAKGRKNTPTGSRSSFAKLTEQNAIDIRSSNEAVKNLAKAYNVHEETIYRIKRFETFQRRLIQRLNVIICRIPVSV